MQVRVKWSILALCLLSVISLHAQNPIGTIMPMPVTQFFDNNGIPLAGGKLYSYRRGSSTPFGTAASSDCLTPNTNPVILDSSGRAVVYLCGFTYKFVLTTASGATVWTQDNVASYAPWDLSALSGTIQYANPSVLVIASNTITPTQNVHLVDTVGGSINLNTISTANVTDGFQLTLTPNNPGANPVVVKNGTGNIILLNGDYTLNATGRTLTLMMFNQTWYQVGASDVNSTSISSATCTSCTLTAYKETKTAPAITAGALAIDLALGNHFTVALNANITSITLSHCPASGNAAMWTLALTADGTPRTIAWAGAYRWASATSPTPTSTNNKVDVYSFLTFDGCANIYSFISGQNF